MRKHHYLTVKLDRSPYFYEIDFNHSKDDQIDIATQAVVEIVKHYARDVFFSYVDSEEDISDHWWCKYKYDALMSLSKYFGKREFDGILKDAMAILSRTLPYYTVRSCTEWLANAPCYPKR